MMEGEVEDRNIKETESMWMRKMEKETDDEIYIKQRRYEDKTAGGRQKGQDRRRRRQKYEDVETKIREGGRG